MPHKKKSKDNLTPGQTLSKIRKSARGSDEAQALRNARKDAHTLASHGCAYPTVAALKAKGYSDVQIEAHRITYEASKRTDEEQAIRRARNAAQILASNGRTCSTPETLKAKGYSAIQIQAYYDAYEAAKGTDEEYAIKKARHDAQVIAGNGRACPTPEILKAKGYNDVLIEAYRVAYEASKGTDEEQAIKQARGNARSLARQGYACPAPEILKAKGYSDVQIKAYQAAHKESTESREKRAKNTLVDLVTFDGTDEEAAILLFSNIQRSNTTSTLATSTALIEKDTSAKTRRLT